LVLVLAISSLIHYAHQRGLPLFDSNAAADGGIWSPDAYGGVLQMLIPWAILIVLLAPLIALPVLLLVAKIRRARSAPIRTTPARSPTAPNP
jgi:hypothetical protein